MDANGLIASLIVQTFPTALIARKTSGGKVGVIGLAVLNTLLFFEEGVGHTRLTVGTERAAVRAERIARQTYMSAFILL